MARTHTYTHVHPHRQTGRLKTIPAFAIAAVIITSVSETIRKPPLIKAQTALTNNKNIIWRKTIFNMAVGFLHPAMWHDHNIDFDR